MQLIEKKSAIIAGVSLIIMAVAAGFSYGYLHSSFITEDAQLTFSQLIENKALFNYGLMGWGVIFVTDLIVALSLCKVFRNVSQTASMITSGIRVAYTLILGVAIYQLMQINGVLIVENLHDASIAEYVQSQILAFERIWSFGLIIFGLHLIGLGYLLLKARYNPLLLGYLLYLGGISYVVVSAIKCFELMSSQWVSNAESILALPMALGEMFLAFWLIYKGVKK